MNDATLFSHPFPAVSAIYGDQAIVTGVKAWYHPEEGWRDYPATSAMATDPVDQVRTLIAAGAVTLQLYIDVDREDTRTADFTAKEL